MLVSPLVIFCLLWVCTRGLLLGKMFGVQLRRSGYSQSTGETSQLQARMNTDNSYLNI
jgi:hypothetical protein